MHKGNSMIEIIINYLQDERMLLNCLKLGLLYKFHKILHQIIMLMVVFYKGVTVNNFNKIINSITLIFC